MDLAEPMDIDDPPSYSGQEVGLEGDVIDYRERPKFVRREKLRVKYSCVLCSDVLVSAHQTICGNQACQKCIAEKFGLEYRISCPLPHGDNNTSESRNSPPELCLKAGLSREQVVPDHKIQLILQKEKCFCRYKELGCKEEVAWYKLQEHENCCKYQEVRCPNKGCNEIFGKTNQRRHLKLCKYALVQCQLCLSTVSRQHFKEAKEYTLKQVKTLGSNLNISNTSDCSQKLVDSLEALSAASEHIKVLEERISYIKKGLKNSEIGEQLKQVICNKELYQRETSTSRKRKPVEADCTEGSKRRATHWPDGAGYDNRDQSKREDVRRSRRERSSSERHRIQHEGRDEGNTSGRSRNRHESRNGKSSSERYEKTYERRNGSNSSERYGSKHEEKSRRSSLERNGNQYTQRDERRT